MSLRERLEGLGKRLGILQAAPVTKEERDPAVKIRTRQVNLDELMSSLPGPQVLAASETRVDLPIGFAGILEAAGVHAPPHGWTVDRLLQFLRQECSQLKRAEAQARALKTLAQAQVPSEDVVRDAIARDQAIDAFARFALERLAKQKDKRQERLATCQEQLQTIQREIDRIKREQEHEDQDWRSWHKSKMDYEKEMAWALSFLMEKPLITIDEEPSR